MCGLLILDISINCFRGFFCWLLLLIHYVLYVWLLRIHFFQVSLSPIPCSHYSISIMFFLVCRLVLTTKCHSEKYIRISNSNKIRIERSAFKIVIHEICAFVALVRLCWIEKAFFAYELNAKCGRLKNESKLSEIGQSILNSFVCR